MLDFEYFHIEYAILDAMEAKFKRKGGYTFSQNIYFE